MEVLLEILMAPPPQEKPDPRALTPPENITSIKINISIWCFSVSVFFYTFVPFPPVTRNCWVKPIITT
jgi:hypothetical protein